MISFSKSLRTTGVDDLKGSSQPGQYVNLSLNSLRTSDLLFVRERDQGVYLGSWPLKASDRSRMSSMDPQAVANRRSLCRERKASRVSSGPPGGTRSLGDVHSASPKGTLGCVAQCSPSWGLLGFHLHELWPYSCTTIHIISYVKYLI